MTEKKNPPRCRMCAKDAYLGPRTGVYSLYCGTSSCKNRDRVCQQCGAQFAVGIDGAGNKYCSFDCRIKGYHPGTSISNLVCMNCGSPGGKQRPNSLWGYVCSTCLKPIRHVVDRLKAHRVPVERALKLLKDPGCEICGANVLEKIRTSGRGKMISALVVDHDHSCCLTDAHSCGKCVRGLLCYHCNWAIGQMQDDPEIARSAASYLESWKASRS